MHPDLETQTEQIPDLENLNLRGTPGVNHVHSPTPTSSLSQAKLNFNLVMKKAGTGHRMGDRNVRCNPTPGWGESY
ncbi:hypothetical protein TNCV_477941 [Trichonephila clavipes]|nr:hypothetical protein TNCV_477941 [Trichonephila clavipes]